MGRKAFTGKRADGSAPAERLTTAEEGTRHRPNDWSPDGRTLVFMEMRPRLGPLWTWSLDDETAKPLVDTFDRQEHAAFSPNGDWIAYAASDGGGFGPVNHIFVEPFPATGARHRVTRRFGVYPVWSHDGTAIFFRRPTRRGRVVRVDIETEPSFGFSEERDTLVPTNSVILHRSFDPMPDGERFVTLVPADGNQDTTPRVNIVLNWTEELKERVPP